MVVTPNSRIRLLKSPIELDEKNQLTFSNITAQTNYFLSLPYLEYDNCSYQRKDEVIRYQTDSTLTYEDLLQYNYCMYQNTSYNEKWFYAFITDIRYVNDGLTEIKIETDVIETWKFDIVYKASFIEREHVADDTIGLHTIPEGLELGDYIDQTVTSEEANSFNFLNESGKAPLVVCACSDVKIPGFTMGTSRSYSNIYSGLIYLTFPNPTSAEAFLYHQDANFSESPIVSIFYAPVPLANPTLTWASCSETIDGVTYSYNYAEVPYSSTADFIKNASISKTNYLDNNYVPKNNKLLCYPYKYFLISNNAGSTFDYKYELFSDSSCSFQINGAIGIGCSIKLQPNNYNKKSGLNPLFSINAGKLPTCAWVNDSYTNWITSNGVNQINTIIGMGAQAVGSFDKLASGKPTEGAVDMVTHVTSVLGERYQRSTAPLQAHEGANQGDFNFAWKLSFSVYKKSIKEEYARIIDDYYSWFGYQVNTFKVPNFETRTYWNYIKTTDLNITGNIPQKDMQKIKDIFNSGITFWHDPSKFLDYSQSNTIVS